MGVTWIVTRDWNIYNLAILPELAIDKSENGLPNLNFFVSTADHKERKDLKKKLVKKLIEKGTILTSYWLQRMCGDLVNSSSISRMFINKYKDHSGECYAIFYAIEGGKNGNIFFKGTKQECEQKFEEVLNKLDESCQVFHL